MILAVCGAVSADQAIQLAESYFSGDVAEPLPQARREAPVFCTGRTHHHQATGMSHIYVGTDAPIASHDDRIPLEVVNSILGDGTSSRLFVSIRETRGLAYAVSSYINSFSDGGVWLTYAGVAPANTDRVIDLIETEFRRILSESLPSQDVELAKAKLRGHMILGLETNGRRASRLANSALHERNILSPDTLLARLDAVTSESAHETLDTYLNLDRLRITTVGPSA